MVDVSHPKDPGQQITRSFKVSFQYGLLYCLLNELELIAEVMAIPDEAWHAPEYGKTYEDDNTYAVGRMYYHKVVVLRLPGIGLRDFWSVSVEESRRRVTTDLM